MWRDEGSCSDPFVASPGLLSFLRIARRALPERVVGRLLGRFKRGGKLRGVGAADGILEGQCPAYRCVVGAICAARCFARLASAAATMLDSGWSRGQERIGRAASLWSPLRRNS